MSDTFERTSTDVAVAGSNIVLVSDDFSDLDGMLFAVKNTGVTNALDASPIIASSPDGSNWTNEDAASIGALATGAYGRARLSNTYGIKYWRLTATCTGVGGTTVSWWVQGRKP